MELKVGVGLELFGLVRSHGPALKGKKKGVGLMSGITPGLTSTRPLNMAAHLVLQGKLAARREVLIVAVHLVRQVADYMDEKGPCQGRACRWERKRKKRRDLTAWPARGLQQDAQGAR